MDSKGAFVISIDHEFGWGYADQDLKRSDIERIRAEQGIVKRILKLLTKYEIPATWAIVGHLLEANCSWEGDRPHPEYVRPLHKNETRDWFRLHPKLNVKDDALWFDSSGLIAEISSIEPKQEIASHSYAHVLYGNPGMTEANVRVDLENMKSVHSAVMSPVYSFIFPRNQEGYHHVLRDYGLRAYRGNSEKWYAQFPNFLKRLGHFIDFMLPYGRIVFPEAVHGLVNIPDSMLLIGRNGFRSLLPAWLVKRKAYAGLRKAVARNGIFHLWFHPSNFSYQTEKQFEIFEDILKRAVYLRREGKLRIATMRQIAESYEG